MPFRAFPVVFIVGMLVGWLGPEARAGGPSTASLQPILKVLDTAKLSGSLRFSGRCEPGYPPDFPQLRVSATSGGSPLQTLREIFADNPAMQVTQDPDGTIRMNESGVPTDLLNVKISRISFEGHGSHGAHGEAAQSATYTPNDALVAILQAPEVVAFMKAHDIERPLANGAAPSNSFGRWPPELPHISGSVDNVTLSEALDRVLKTFPGVWFYENCAQSDKRTRVVYFRFQYLEKTGGRVLVVE